MSIERERSTTVPFERSHTPYSDNRIYDPGCSDTLEMLVNKEAADFTEQERKLLLYMHRWNKYHFEPFKAQFKDHLMEADEYFSLVKEHIKEEERIKKQFNRIEALLWAVGTLSTFLVAVLGVHQWAK